MFSKVKTIASYAALAALGAGLAGQVNAQYRQNDGGIQQGFHPYAGANYGFYKSGDGDYDEDRDLWEVYGGLGLHQWFGVEANYANLGDMSNEFAELSADGWGLSVVGQLPLSEAFGIYAKLGQFFWDADVDLDGDISESFDGNDPFYTIGGAFAFSAPLSVTLEYTRYNTDIGVEELDEAFEDSDSDNVDTVKLGVRFAF